MQIVKKTSVAGEYAKKGEDILPDDTVTILSAGDISIGQYGEQYVFKIQTRNGEKNVNFNQTTLNVLHDELGSESSEWVGKEVVIRMKKDVVANKKVDIYFFVTPNWDFDEYRELVNKTPKAESDTVDFKGVNAEAQIAVEDIPL